MTGIRGKWRGHGWTWAVEVAVDPRWPACYFFSLSTSANHKVRFTRIKNEARAEVWEVNIRKPQQIKAKNVCAARYSKREDMLFGNSSEATLRHTSTWLAAHTERHQTMRFVIRSTQTLAYFWKLQKFVENPNHCIHAPSPPPPAPRFHAVMPQRNVGVVPMVVLAEWAAG